MFTELVAVVFAEFFSAAPVLPHGTVKTSQKKIK